jgi:dinuclear metal center YbgI/SA1388 family protein
MRIAEIIGIMDTWAPGWSAMEKDNVGLQVGDRQNSVTGILLSLDVTEQVIDEAIKKKAELIISHHPLLFRSIKAVDASDSAGRLILKMAQNGIALFSAHTNLDFTKDGVSFSLARTLGLKNIRFLSPIKNSLAKITVFVPQGNSEKVMHAMSAAGAGTIGEYSSCSFSTAGTGTFRGSAASNPAVGRRERLEFVEEIRLEMTAPRSVVPQVISAMKEVHPYEEPAYDVFLNERTDPNFGMGALGTLPKPLSLGGFLKTVKRILGCGHLRYSESGARTVGKVAVCGGAGGDLLPEAISSGADIFITSDIKYHAFHSAADRIVLVDAGHWETERVVLKSVAEKLQTATCTTGKPPKIFITRHDTNPVRIV